MRGEVHGTQAPRSRRHSTTAAGSSTVNPKVTSRTVVIPAGPETIWTWGAVASTVQVVVTVFDRLPAGSWARMPTVWRPFDRFGTNGLVQGSHGPPSTWHATEAVGSSAAKVNRLSATVVVPDGRWLTVSCGATVSTVQVTTAGDGSWSPAASARTWTWC